MFLVALAILVAVTVCCWLPAYFVQLEHDRALDAVGSRPMPGFRAGGVTYWCDWTKAVDVEEDDIQILGYIQDYLKTREDDYGDEICTFPSAVGEPYGEYGSQMLLRFDGEWHKCVPLDQFGQMKDGTTAG